MRKNLYDLLASFGFPVFLQGSLAADEPYPESFFTFWNNDSFDNNHYDNRAAYITYNFDVNFYSCHPALVDETLMQARSLLKQNGFVIGGKGYDLASDEPTHTGRGFTALIIDMEV